MFEWCFVKSQGYERTPPRTATTFYYVNDPVRAILSALSGNTYPRPPFKITPQVGT